VTAKQRVIIITGDHPQEGIDGYGEKDFENEGLRRDWKTSSEMSASGRTSGHDDGEELGDDDGSDWRTPEDQTDKEHED